MKHTAAAHTVQSVVACLQDGLPRLVPLLSSLFDRCGGIWTEAEQREWTAGVDDLFDELASELLRRVECDA